MLFINNKFYMNILYKFFFKHPWIFIFRIFKNEILINFVMSLIMTKKFDSCSCMTNIITAYVCVHI